MDESLKKILTGITINGYKAYVVGGYTRDYFMLENGSNCDIDIATNAPINELLDIFSKYKPSVLRYNTLNFNYGDYHVDIAHFREERFVNNELIISFTDSLYIDSLRRDFTINAIYIDENGEITDFHNGVEDAKCKYLRFIGHIKERLDEDPSRLLRYMFLLFKYDLNYEDAEYNFLKANISKYISLCSPEIINKYIIKIVNSCNLNSLVNRFKSIGVYDLLFNNSFKGSFNSISEFFSKTNYRYYDELPKKYRS